MKNILYFVNIYLNLHITHALQICPHNEVPIRYRHDASLEAIAAATRKRNLTCNLLVDSTMPGYPGDALCPDIQLLNETKKQAIICDLAIVFERGQLHDGQTVFGRCRQQEHSLWAIQPRSTCSPIPESTALGRPHQSQQTNLALPLQNS